MLVARRERRTQLSNLETSAAERNQALDYSGQRVAAVCAALRRDVAVLGGMLAIWALIEPVPFLVAAPAVCWYLASSLVALWFVETNASRVASVALAVLPPLSWFPLCPRSLESGASLFEQLRPLVYGAMFGLIMLRAFEAASAYQRLLRVAPNPSFKRTRQKRRAA